MGPTPLPVILNLESGRTHTTETAERLRAIFERLGIPAEVLVANDGGAILRRAAEALARRPEAIVAAGGDGTVSAIAGCLAGSGVALGVLPAGTFNNFARDLGIPMDIEEAAAVFAKGRRVAVDLGEVNDRIFVNNASLGLYADIVRDRLYQQRRLGRGRFRAMAWATLAALRRSSFLQVHLEVNGREHHFAAPFVFVGNNDYTMEGFAIGRRSSLRDGRLSIYTTQRRTRLGLLGLALRAIVGRLRQAEDFAIESAARLTIDSRRRRLWIATDGELSAMETPLTFRVRAGALQVIAPESHG